MRKLIVTLSFACICSSGFADPNSQSKERSVAPVLGRQIAERTANQRVVQTISAETNQIGRVEYRTNSFVEMANGMNFRDTQGEWRESEAKIEISPEGNGVARKGAHKVVFAPNINTRGVVELTTPDNKTLKSHVIGLSYYDFKKRQSVMIAEVKDSGGVIVGDNQVVYEDAFTDIKADIRYTYTLDGMEQDIILRERPSILPEDVGFDPRTTWLEVWTEFIDPPEPVKEQHIRKGWRESRVDKILDFGAMVIPEGTAFGLGEKGSKHQGIPVHKHWITTPEEGRTFLIEEVDFRWLTPQLRALPEAKEVAPANKANQRQASRHRIFPERLEAKVKSDTKLEYASLVPDRPGFVIDYAIVSSTANFTFQGDTTYYVSGNINLSGTTIIEGGTVIKYTNGASINILGTLDYQTESYRPAILTSYLDSSVGQTIASGTPSGTYADVALNLANGGNLHNLHIRYANKGIYSGQNYTISHGQFIHCNYAMQTENATFTANNILMYQVGTGFYGRFYHGTATHLTFNQGTKITDDWNFYSGVDCSGIPSSQITLVNSLITGVANNGIVPINIDHTTILSSSVGVYQTVGAGSHYLAQSSLLRDVGTTQISPTLLNSLKRKTTFPPIKRENESIMSDETLSPHVPNDEDTPDLGYHYDPIDYILDEVTVEDTLRLTNGVAVASGFDHFGFSLIGAKFYSVGSPLRPNLMFSYAVVQEIPIFSASGKYPRMWDGTESSGTVFQAEFTEFSQLAYGFYGFGATPTTFSIKHSSFKGGRMGFYPNSGDIYGFSFENTLFERVTLQISENHESGIPPYTDLLVQNCLFFKSSIDLLHYIEGENWMFHNNVFDNTGVYLDSTYDPVYNSHNAYINCSPLPDSQGHDKTLSSFNWQNGPLGKYYQPANSLLIDAGILGYSTIGFYHFTTQGNQDKEADSNLDIGLHYVALGNDGLPIDSGNNGIPDYLEDLNGNGVVDAGESDFIPPIITITAPLNAASFTTDRVNVSGTFVETSIKRITVNGVLAFISGSAFQALNVSLESGANTITATAEDLNGNTATASITITGVPDGSGNLIDPVQLVATPIGGFAPLTVTLTPSSAAPGTFQQAQYDFNGDGIIDQTASGLSPITHIYSTAGEYFPVITIQTTAGKFSSLGGWNAGFSAGERLQINVQAPPVQLDSFTVTDPVDLKWINGSLYVLSRSAASITQYDAAGNVVRSITGIGSAPRGLDVDSAGNVYLAMTGDNQVWKFNPTPTSFQADTTFNTTGHIGGAGTGPSQFNAPFDVAVTLDGEEIVVSDSGNHRIQRFTKNGVFIDSFGRSGTSIGEFTTPKGLTYDAIGSLHIVDSGNNRIAFARSSDVLSTSGAAGTALGQFQGAVNLSVGSRGIYVADTGNNRIQKLAQLALSSELGLNQPNAVAAIVNLLEERIYIADTGNNRILLVKLPSTGDPKAVWDAAVLSLVSGNIEAAIPYFSAETADKYRQVFLSIGTTDLTPIISGIPAISPVFIGSDTAQYRFDQLIQGFTITFPIEFIKENGMWKILEY